MNTHASVASADSDLDALLSCLDLDGLDEAPLPSVEDLGEMNLEAAVKGAEAQEAINEHYESEPAELEAIVAPVDPMSDPASLMTDVPSEAVPAKKAKAPKAPKEPKEKKAPAVRKHYASKSERTADKLGAELGDYTVLEFEDAALTGDALAAKQAETMEIMKNSGVKVAMRMGYMMEFAAGKSAELNFVATTALRLLKEEGKLTTGESGNFHTELVKKYSKNSASSMGNNTLASMRSLKMITLSAKGEYIGNPNSLYLAKVGSMLGL